MFSDWNRTLSGNGRPSRLDQPSKKNGCIGFVYVLICLNIPFICSLRPTASAVNYSAIGKFTSIIIIISIIIIVIIIIIIIIIIPMRGEGCYQEFCQGGPKLQECACARYAFLRSLNFVTEMMTMIDSLEICMILTSLV